MAMQAVKFGFGQSVLRKEDDPLLRGIGRYIADIAPRETLHAVVLWSPHAHARFHIDAVKSRAMSGVRLVLTGAETEDLGLLPCTVELFLSLPKSTQLWLIPGQSLGDPTPKLF
jgi:carbon-monoxide dehydrogenase large subunit